MEKGTGMARLAILVGGGPAPGINSAIRATTIEAINAGVEVIGILNGFQHLIVGRTDMVRQLTVPDVSSIHFQRGSILRTSRANPMSTPEALTRTVQTLSKLGVSHLVTIGGDDTAFAASEVAKSANGRMRVAHIPKTIDNDLPLPGGMPTFGFETARHVGTDLLLNLKEDSRTTGRWYFVGVMGRKAGHLALGMSSAAGATLAIIPEEFPEERIPLDRVVNTLQGAILKREVMGRSDGVAVIAEGIAEKLDPEEVAKVPGVEVEHDPYGNIRLAEIPLATMLKREVRRRFAERGKPRVIVDVTLGYELRCAPPIPFDIDYTRTLGYAAARFLLSERDNARPPSTQHGGLIYIEGNDARILPFGEMLDQSTGRTQVRLVDINSQSHEVARRYMIRLERRDLEDSYMQPKLAEAAGMTPEELLQTFGDVV